MARPSGSEIVSTAGETSCIWIETRISWTVERQERIHLTAYVWWIRSHCRWHLLRTGPNILKSGKIGIAHSLILVVEIAVGVKGVSKWGRYRLRTKIMRWRRLLSPTVALITGCSIISRRETEGSSWCLERGRVDGRHPNSGFINLEEVRDKVVEVDVAVGKVVEGELLAIPRERVNSLFGGRCRGTHIWNSASKISIFNLCSMTFC